MSKHDVVGGVFEAIRKSFSKFNDTDLHVTVRDINDIRNKYIAHQEKELTDIKTAKEGLTKWVNGLFKIYFAHHQINFQPPIFKK